MAEKQSPAAETPRRAFNPLYPPKYVERSHEILAVERELYLKARREKNQLPPPAADNLTGLCISGGGVRSATLGLGMLQAFIRAGVLKKIDYLSTVSGGGYIGSCLTSLLSREPNNVRKFSGKPNRNLRFNPSDTGVDELNCPLALRHNYEYLPLQQTTLTPKHQLLHLRRYGEYLTPRKGLLGWDVSRAVGALFSGVFIHGLLFLLILATIVLLHHVLFASISGGQFMGDLQFPRAQHVYNIDQDSSAAMLPVSELVLDTLLAKQGSLEQLQTWYRCQLYPQFYLVIRAVQRQWIPMLAFLLFGAVLGWVFVKLSRRLPRRVAENEQDEAEYADPAKDKLHDRPGGDDMQRFVSEPFIRRFTIAAYMLGPVLAYATTIILAQFGVFVGEDYFVMLALPVGYAVGLFLAVHLSISLYYINNAPEEVSGRLYRSYYTGMQGATFMGIFISLLFPVGIILLFGKHGLVVGLLFSFLPVAVAYYFTMQSLGGKSGSTWLKDILAQVQTPLLNLSILLFSGLALAWVSNLMFELETMINSNDGFRFSTAFLLLVISTFLVVTLGMAANSNDISLHYFYRDRLSEAYLRTDGRVERPAGAGNQVRPKELFDVTLRNHENLRLTELGEDNFRGPYHIIVSALNLQGSNDLAKKTLKSDHFIFSKYFIGSRTTGYYRTSHYRGGSTKLSTAMAISAAAVASGMGLMSFAASNFYMTLFNLRTGYWIENPWHLHKEQLESKSLKERQRARRNRTARFIRLCRRLGLRRLGGLWSVWKMRRFPFWLRYLLREFSGQLSADTRLVYVSDGGHTGDNLGMLPLVQRRCRTIVIADFEEDGKYSFGSFNQAVRLSKSIYNVDIEIDLKPFFPIQTDEGLLLSPASVATGTIQYPATSRLPAMQGKIVYMKSSVSLLQQLSDIRSGDTFPPPQMEPAPVFVLNYFKNNPAFPHQSTADQYFDEVQFEAYRMLGEHIGKQACSHGF
ncbi:MAG: patatin-like phospholipase family protein [Saprospirales bacterium]|nr:patatin-like phospholipase family protein [Saprospirales bacterium]MBK8923888.1 patatin-like phospholipase family protein [Saprospirales bacterium]